MSTEHTPGMSIRYERMIGVAAGVIMRCKIENWELQHARAEAFDWVRSHFKCELSGHQVDGAVAIVNACFPRDWP